jgi:hypothetical protein
MPAITTTPARPVWRFFEETAREERPGLRLLVLGLLLGVLADASLRRVPWGLNATLLTAALVGTVLLLQLGQGTRAGAGRIGYSLAALAFATGFVWRDAPELKLLDFLGLVVTLGLLASEREDLGGSASLGGYVLRISGSMAHAAFGPPLLVTQDADWSRLRLGSLPPLLLGVTRGLVVTLPLLVVFTALLASADAVFSLRVTQLADVDLVALLGHLVGIFFWGWIAAGILRAAVLRERPAHAFPARPSWLALGRLEVVMALSSLNLLFGAFVWIQLRYLFGGAEWVQQVAGLTYAEYARQGFFELVAVTALVLPVLLAAHWLLNPETRGQKGTFAVLAGIQVLLVLVMLASALERMRLYRAEYGLTELRFYTTAFMAWLAVLLIAFLATVLAGRRDLFARAVLVSAFVAVFLLHAADPEARIVRTNAVLARGFDVRHALQLSADAGPALVATLPSLDPERRAALAGGLLKRWGNPDTDWRSWSFARARSRQAMEGAAPELLRLAPPEAPLP